MLSLLLLAPAAAAAQDISPEALRRHIDVLASDAFEGREPGTAGETKTTDYIVSQWKAVGLQPAGEGGTWYQKVPLVSRVPVSQAAAWKAKRRSFRQDRSKLLLIGRGPSERIVNAPVYYVDPEAELDGAKLEGAVVLTPYAAREGLPEYRERARVLAGRGAAAVISVFFGRDFPWEAVQRSYAAAEPTLDRSTRAAISGALSHRGAEELFEAGGTSFDEMVRLGTRAGSRPHRLALDATLEAATDIRRFASNNVLGRLPGSGRTGQSVLYLGHWDHVGICRPEGERDRICNGAVDNASGIAALIEIARAFAAGPRPPRDILLLATTAEEMGLLGAEYFAAHPTVPLASIVAAVNLDTIAIAPEGEKVAVLGRGFEPLDRLIEEAVKEAGRTLDRDGEADGFVTRQDGWALAAVGIPAVMVGGSFSDMAKLNAFLSGAYHGPDDNPGAGLELGGAAEDTALMVRLGRKLADPAKYAAAPRPGN